MNTPWHILTSARPLARRRFLAATGSLAAAACWASRALGAVNARPVFSADPFSLGVASGDPTSTGVVLWTRLAPLPLEGGGMPAEDVKVRWRVADDERMSRVVAEGETIANPEWAHSVHVEVDGLRPDRWYWYQFHAGLAASPVGRTRTMPAEDTLPDRLRFAFASCQHYEAGHYTAYEHMAGEDVDLVAHLGDYIYEGAPREKQTRRHTGGKLTTLADYRNRYALYKTDAALQMMHAAAPWIVTWDDHEVENNYAAGVSARPKADREQFLRQRAAAYQAYYEHMPLRRSALPKGPDMMLYRSLAFGRLASFAVLDTRQYRSPEISGGGRAAPSPEALSADRSLLGSAQRDWLFQRLGSSPATWNVLAQQIMMALVDRAPGDAELYVMDQWPGYEADRRRVLSFLSERRIANPVVLTGDIHSNWANELSADFERPGGAPIAAEFVGTSITSGGDGKPVPADHDQVLGENPGTRFFNTQRGYVHCELTPKSWTTNYRVVDYVSRPGAPLKTAARYTLEAGKSALQAG
jgi:alkaline phosphatase D